MWIVHWIGYHTGKPARWVAYHQYTAESFAAAIRSNGCTGVWVERGPVVEPSPLGVIVPAASWRAVEA